MTNTRLLITIFLGFLYLIPVCYLSGSIIEKGNELVIGEVVKIQSKILNEERSMWIYLPDDYNKTKDSYPVLYLLDGKYHFFHVSGIVDFLSSGKIPRMIVVAVHNTDRNRDLLPTTVNNFPPVAASDKFMLFIKDELIPHIEKRYRTAYARILCGHSYGGLFTIHFMLTYPDLFKTYIAVSPSIYWDDRLIFKKAGTFFKNNPDFKRFLYHSTAGGDREAILQANRDFKQFLKDNAPPNLDWHFRFFEREDHGSTVHPSIYTALETFYSGWSIPIPLLSKMTIAQVRNHYRKLSEKHGYDIPVPHRILNIHGILLLRQDKLDAALESILFFISKDPGNPVLFYRKGLIYESQGKLQLAKDAFETGIELAEKTKHRALAAIKKALVELLKKIQ